MASQRQIDQYLLHEELGHGGMATVFRATDTQLQRDVAIKILHDHIASQPENRERFLREARAAARLSHPNILKIYGFSSADDAVGYLVMERIDGPTLRSLDARDLRLLPELAAALIYVVARALAHAHENGILHRDIKPENIMIDSQGHVRLMDFGLARLLDAHSMTATGSLLGSPAHMAPEIVEGKSYDARVDVFALGTVFYFVATGHLPYEASNPATLLNKILNGEYEPARDLNPSISSDLSRLIDRTLARDPEQRIATPAQLAELLGAWLADVGIPDPESTFRTWYADRDETVAALKPQLEAAWIQKAESTSRKGRSAIPQVLDYANRVLLLNPENIRAHELIESVAVGEGRVRWIRRASLAISAVALVGLASSLFAWKPEPTLQIAKLEAPKIPPAEEIIPDLPEEIIEELALPVIPDGTLTQSERRVAQALDRAERMAQAQGRIQLRRERERQAREGVQSEPTSPPADSDSSSSTVETFLVSFYVQPPAAEIFVGGEKRCAGGGRCDLRLAQGIHEVVARHPATGMETRERVNVRQAGTEVRLRVPWRPGTIVVEANRAGVVIFNGRRIGRTDTPIEVPIEGIRSTVDGTLRVIPDGDFGTPVERQISIASGEIRRVSVSF